MDSSFQILSATAALLALYIVILARWQRGFILLLVYLPFAGLVTLSLNLWQPSLILKDVLFAIPLYISFFSPLSIPRRGAEGLPPIVGRIMLLLTFLVLVQAIADIENNILMGLIGIKVWLFYLPLCYISYAFADSNTDLVGLFQLLSALSFLPALAALIQIGMVEHMGYRAAMDLSYGSNAFDTTQGYALFTVGSGSFGRIPSIFTFATQFLGFELAMLVPTYVVSQWGLSLRWRRVGYVAFGLTVLGAFISGERAAFIFIPLMVGLIVYFDRGIHGLLGAASKMGILLWTAVTAVFGIALTAMYSFVSSLFVHYAGAVAYGGLAEAIQLAPLGMGTGTNTGAARYALSDPSQLEVIETYYAKAVYELGIPGLLLVLALFCVPIVFGFKARSAIKTPALKCSASALLAFFLMIFLNSFKGALVDLDPVNIYYWIFCGLLLKLIVLDKGEGRCVDSLGSFPGRDRASMA